MRDNIAELNNLQLRANDGQQFPEIKSTHSPYSLSRGSRYRSSPACPQAVLFRSPGCSTRNSVFYFRELLNDGHLFPLATVATIDKVLGQPQINRDNLRRMVTVTARIQGRDMGSVIPEVQQMMANLIPSGVYYELGGLYKQQQGAFKELMAVFAAVTTLLFLLLTFLFENFRIATAIISGLLIQLPLVLLAMPLIYTALQSRDHVPR